MKPLDWIAIRSRVASKIDPERRYTHREAVLLLGIKPQMIRHYIVITGELPAVQAKRGHRKSGWLILGRDLVTFLREQAYFAPRPRAA